MRVEVRYPDGRTHEVDLPEPLATIGRDPAADLVLYDKTCSRKHAVLETTNQGVFIRDAGSRHGTCVNGKRIERRLLAPGDAIQMGTLTVRLAPDTGAPPFRPVAAERFDPSQLTSVTDQAFSVGSAPTRAAKVLGLGWAAFSAVFAGIGLAFFVAFEDPTVRWPALLAGGVLAAWSVVMAWGWVRLARWAKPLQFVSSAVGALLCPLTITALVAAAYAARRDTHTLLSGTVVPPAEVARLQRADRAYAVLIAISLLLSALLLTLGTVYVLSSGGWTFYAPRGTAFIH